MRPAQTGSPAIATSLYKYLPRKFAKAMIRDGSIKIGTLHGYRAIELGPAIGDPAEGRARTFEHHAHTVTDDPAQRSWLTNKMIQAPKGTPLTLTGITLQYDHDTPDLYVYCTTERFSSHAMNEFGADACVEIHNPLGFAKELDRHLRRRGMVIGGMVGRCEYDTRVRSVSMPQVPAYLLKEPKHAYQREVRMLWYPTEKTPRPLEAQILTIPSLRKYVRMFDV